MSSEYRETRGGKEKGETVMQAKEGDIFKSGLDGAEYIVKKVVNSMVVLESQDGKKKIMTGMSSLEIKSFYEKKEDAQG